MVEVITERRSPPVWLTIGSSGGTLKDKKTSEMLASLKLKEGESSHLRKGSLSIENCGGR